MIKTSLILFVLFYFVSAHSQQTIDKLNSNQLKLPKETISKALSIDATGQVKSSSTSSTELGYLSGVSSAIQTQIDDKANDADAVHLTGDESISGVKTLTGKLVTSSTVNASIPCPVMTEVQRDAIVSPVTGDCVFNSNTSLSNIYDGAIWKAMGGSGGGISLWVSANGYAVDDVVIESNNIYICLAAHTSGTFATDLAALKWQRLSTDVTGATGVLPLISGGTNSNITNIPGAVVVTDADSMELTAGTSGQILQSNGTSTPSFVNKSISAKAQNDSSVGIEELQVPNNQLTETTAGKYLNETGNNNILINPNFEHSTFSTGWTNSAGTFTQETSVLISGKASAKLVLSAQTMSLTQSSTLYAAQYADGVQGLVSVRIKSNVALKVCSIQAGTVSTSNCVNVSSDNKWGLYKVPFILGATSNGISIASTGSVSGTVYADHAFVGATDLSQNISACQAVDCTTTFTVNVAAAGAINSQTLNWLSGCTNVSGTVACTFSAEMQASTISGLSCVGNRVGSGGGTATVLAGNSSTTGFSFTSGTTTSNVTVYTCVRQGTDYVAAMSRSNGNTYSSNNADTDWKDCGLTGSAFTGFGTSVPTPTLQCKRQGSDLLMKGKFLAGTGTTAVEARMALPVWNGVQLVSAGSSVIPNLQIAGILGSSVTATTYFGLLTLIEPSVSYVTFGAQQSTTSAISKAVGNSIAATGTTLSITARIPIEGWNNSNIIIGSFNGLQSCVDTLSCTDTFSAKIDSAGNVSDENIDWVSGNCTVSGTSVYTCTPKAGIFTVAPTCVVAANPGAFLNYASMGNTTTASSLVYRTSNYTGVAQAQNANIVCQKQGADYIGKTAMAVASDQNVRSIGSTGVDIQSVIFGTGANCASVCSTGTCSLCNQSGSKITSVTWNATGSYNVNGLDGTKYLCTGGGEGTSYVNAYSRKDLSTSSLVRVHTGIGVTLTNSAATIICIGIP